MGTNPKATTRVFWIIYRYVVQIDYVKVKKMPKATQTNPNCHGWDREENSRPWIYARTWPICTQEAACVTTWGSFPDCWSDKQVSTGKLALWLTADIHAMALGCVLFCDMGAFFFVTCRSPVLAPLRPMLQPTLPLSADASGLRGMLGKTGRKQGHAVDGNPIPKGWESFLACYLWKQ